MHFIPTCPTMKRNRKIDTMRRERCHRFWSLVAAHQDPAHRAFILLVKMFPRRMEIQGTEHACEIVMLATTLVIVWTREIILSKNVPWSVASSSLARMVN